MRTAGFGGEVSTGSLLGRSDVTIQVLPRGRCAPT
jgi:hypothetical protein